MNNESPATKSSPAAPAAAQESGLIGRVTQFISRVVDYPIPAELLKNPEDARRARLVSRFGSIGSLFGSVYAITYLLIGHKWGAGIVLVCSACYAITPLLMRRKNPIQLVGHFLTLILTLGFTSLCFVEGGLQGHAIAWLVSVPLCALLLLGRQAATRWAVVAFLAAGLVAAFDLAGVKLPVTYDHKWNSLVSAGGYLGLIAFMFILGLVFETGRARAFAKMQQALSDLAHSNDRLVHLNNEKNEFLGIAAHDLRNPLTVILSSADLAATAKDQTQVARLAGNIIGAARRMRDLIGNLLDVNAIEQGKFTSHIEPCDMCALVKQCVENYQTAAAKKSIEIRLGTSDGLWALADAAATLQILDNLISNALKYSPLSTTVHVHALPEANHIIVVVRDEGPGISEADQKKMFQKFTRLSARPTAGEPSTGLGLAIVKRLTEAMSGTIQCHSTLGAGSSFTLRLPVCQQMMNAQKIVNLPVTKPAGAPDTADSLLKFPGQR